MGFRDSIICSIISILCLTSLCSAAPTRQAQNRMVLTWLEEWTKQLKSSAENTFRKYQEYHFSHRVNNMPFFYLGILWHNFTRHSFTSQTTDKITEAICRQLMEFTTPVYLALFDESDRFNSDPELTKLLLNVSVALNSTLEMARYLHVRMFPRANQAQVAQYWSRNKMKHLVKTYKDKSRDQAEINKLRSWATLSEVNTLASVLNYLETNFIKENVNF